MPDDLVGQLRRRWDKGEFLTAFAQAAPWNPLSFPLRGPNAADVASDYGAVQDWLNAWHSPRPAPIRIEYRRIGGRTIGANTIPSRAWIDSYDSLWALLNVRADVEWFVNALAVTRDCMPRLADWMLKHSMQTLAHRHVWHQLIDTVNWIDGHPKPVFVRQIDVLTVDTKFIEQHRLILTDLLEIQLDGARVDQSAPRSDFAARFRLLSKPTYVRFRLLDPTVAAKHGFSELTVRADELPAAPAGVSTVYVVENETTYLAFPPIDHSAVIFGGGYAVTTLRHLGWLSQTRLIYWGDIDTHGLAILDRVRRQFPHTESMLMTAKVLTEHEQHWVTEQSQATDPLARLTQDEAQLYRDLVEGTYGPSVRLEQERIRFSALCEALGQS